MLENILDKYYAKKIENNLRNALKVFWIDKKFTYTKHLLELYVKPKKWKDEQYILIMAIPYTECFDILVNRYTQLETDIVKFVKERVKEN